MASRFLCTGPFITGTEFPLPADQSHHLLHVLRAQIGQQLELIDGKGVLAHATLSQIRGSIAVATITEVTPVSARPRVALAFGITKGASMEFIFKRCTEIGIHAFQPLITRHSLAPDRWNGPRWEKIVGEVIKQCQSGYLPEIRQPLKLSEWLGRRSPASPLAFCDENARDEKAALISQNQTIDLLVGSEGGWAQEERAEIERYGASRVGLGANRLRAETACLVALVLVKKEIGELA